MTTTVTTTGITFPDSTTQTTAASASLPGVLGQVFTSSGTFTIPTGVTAVKVTVVGGGGSATGYTGSGCCTSASNGNAGGTSSVSSGTQTISTISATGGGAGIVNTASGLSLIHI